MLFDSVAAFLGNIQCPKTIVSGNVLVSSQKTKDKKEKFTKDKHFSL